jgi:cytochrome c
MKQFYAVLAMFIAVSMIFVLSGRGDAAGKGATREECVAKTKAAAEMFREKGVEETAKIINDKKGPFVWKDTYIFCFEEDTYKMIAHAYAKSLHGRSMKNYKDADGLPVFQEFVKALKDKGEAWVTYKHVRAPGEKPRVKLSYVMKVKGKNIIVGAGIYQ